MLGFTPDITAVAVVRHGVLQPVFARATTEAGFDEVFVDDESGTFAWPGGADLAPDTFITTDPRSEARQGSTL